VESKFTNSPFIEQVVALGHGRKFMSALIVPAYDYILLLLKEKGFEYDESLVKYAVISSINTCVEVGPEVAGHAMVQELVQKEVDSVNRQLEEYETVKKFVIVPRKFTEMTGELTATLKIKPRVVFENFAKEIEEMYKE
ncbi:MAG: hypothetical protein ACM3PP_03195, partial [Candidatus Saccharibacteria bacterium]